MSFTVQGQPSKMQELIGELIIGIKMYPGVNGLGFRSENLPFICKVFFSINMLIVNGRYL